MIGQGLNSLIPPRDPNQGNQQGQQNAAPVTIQANYQQAQPAAAVNTPASQGASVQRAPQPEPQRPPIAEVIHVDPEVLARDAQAESFGIDHAKIAEVIHISPEQLRSDKHAELILESINDTAQPNEETPAMQQIRQDISSDVAYRPLGQEEPNKRPGSFSKRTALDDAVFHIEVEKIKSNPYQPRKHFDEDALKDLANSIREFGILQPLVVTKIETESPSGVIVEYQLIAGERRLMASKRAGLERVPVIIRQSADRAEQLELAIIENLQRENLDTIETARSYARLQDEFGMTQREIAARLGKSREVIGNALRLLGLPVEIQDALSHNQINESQARLLLSIPNMTVQKQLFSDLLSKSFSVRELKAKIKNIHNPPQANAQPAFVDQRTEDLEVRDLQNRLKDSLGTDVKIEKRGESGRIVINFYSTEELYGVVKRINPGQE